MALDSPDQQVTETTHTPAPAAHFPTHFPHRPLPTITQMERETRWEIERQRKAGELVHKEMSESALADCTPGQRIIREIIPGLIKAIGEVQQARLDEMAAGSKNPSMMPLYLQILPAETLAVITLRSALAQRSVEAASGRSHRSVSAAIGRAIQAEAEFMAWARAEKAADKKAQEEGERRLNLLWLMETHYKDRSAKSWARWKSRWKIAVEEPWSFETQLQVGAFLLDMMVQHSKGWFEVRLVGRKGKTEITLCLSEEAHHAIRDITTEAALSRPPRGPMLCQPRRWQWIDNKGDR